jgi:hypothetical protein
MPSARSWSHPLARRRLALRRLDRSSRTPTPLALGAQMLAHAQGTCAKPCRATPPCSSRPSRRSERSSGLSGGMSSFSSTFFSRLCEPDIRLRVLRPDDGGRLAGAERHAHYVAGGKLKLAPAPGRNRPGRARPGRGHRRRVSPLEAHWKTADSAIKEAGTKGVRYIPPCQAHDSISRTCRLSWPPVSARKSQAGCAISATSGAYRRRRWRPTGATCCNSWPSSPSISAARRR